MSDTLEQQQEPVETPAALSTDAPIGAAPASSDSWDSVQQLLDEYDSRVGGDPSPAEPTPDNNGQEPLSSAELDKFINELSGPSADQQKITALEGEIGSLRAAELERQSARDFEGFSAELQKQLGPNLPEDYAKTSLLAAAAQDENLLAAWKYRSLTAEQLAQADKEFRELEALHFRVTHSPDTDPRKAQAIQMIEQRGRELGLAMNARAIIMNARRAVLKRAEAHKVVDEDATQLRAELTAFIRDGGSGRGIPPEAPPNFATMDDRTFREYTRKHYGF